MRSRPFCKKLKSSLILLVSSVVLLSTILSSVSTIHNAHAAGGEGSLYSARAKMIYQAFDTCIRGQINRRIGNPSNERIRVMRGGRTNEISLGFGSIMSSGAPFVHNYYIENAVSGTGTSSDSVYCADLGNYLSILSDVTIDYKNDFLCKNNGAEYGVLERKEGVICKDRLTEILQGDDWNSYAQVGDALETLFTDKVFGGNVPGGDLYSFTDLEKYYAYLDGFKSECITSNHYTTNPDSGGVGIPEVNANGEIEMRYYSVGNRSREVGFTEGDSHVSCSTLASWLDPAGVPVQNGLIPHLGAECQEKYDSNVNSIKDWWNQHRSEYPSATSAVEQFLASLSSTGWTYDASTPKFTCNAANVKEQWDSLVSTFGFEGAVALDESWHTSTAEEIRGTGGTIEGETATCHDTAGALGWILCPVLEGAASAAKWAYETVIEPSLRIRSGLFNTTGDDNGAYRAWGTFRDIANIIFAVLFLFVIFSQVTGWGIDNYGIKKTLPNLIVAAVLVNLSFVICQALVDVSNIAGSGIYNLIERISGEMRTPDLGLGGNVSYITSIGFTICAVIAAGAIASAAMGGFWTMLGAAFLAVLPVLLSSIVAILFLFFLLAMRQAVVVMLVAISPLAFVAYALPNTKNLFKRWSDLLRGMLILYPTCAIMIAGGRLASKVILVSGAAENNLFIILVAMVAEAGPLFLIPGITRNAYRATGQLGTTLNNLRGRMVGGTSRRVRNNQSFQNAQDRNQRRRITAATGRTQRRISAYNASAATAPASRTLRDRWRLRAGNQERIAQLNQAALQAEEQQRNINQMSDATQVAGMRAAARISNAQTQGKNNALGSASQAEIDAAVRGATTQAAISANQQRINNADYADANFANAVITQATIEHDASHDRQMNYDDGHFASAVRRQNEIENENRVRGQLNWNNLQYRRGKRNTGILAAENDLADTQMMRDADIVSGKREQARISRDASRQNALHYNDPTFQAAAAASLAQKEQLDNIKSRESLLANGHFTYTDGAGTHTVNALNAGELRQALAYTLSSAYTGTDRAADIHALTNTMAAMGDAGRSAVHDALSDAESSMGGITDDARQAISTNIMRNHAQDFKNNQRSVFDYAAANTGAAAGRLGIGGYRNDDTDPTHTRAATFADYSAKAVNSLKQEQLVAMDEAELRRYLNAFRGNDGRGHAVATRLTRADAFASHADYVVAEQEAQANLQRLAQETLSNADVLKSLKGSQRALLEEIATLPSSSYATP